MPSHEAGAQTPGKRGSHNTTCLNQPACADSPTKQSDKSSGHRCNDQEQNTRREQGQKRRMTVPGLEQSAGRGGEPGTNRHRRIRLDRQPDRLAMLSHIRGDNVGILTQHAQGVRDPLSLYMASHKMRAERRVNEGGDSMRWQELPAYIVEQAKQPQKSSQGGSNNEEREACAHTQLHVRTFARPHSCMPVHLHAQASARAHIGTSTHLYDLYIHTPTRPHTSKCGTHDSIGRIKEEKREQDNDRLRTQQCERNVMRETGAMNCGTKCALQADLMRGATCSNAHMKELTGNRKRTNGEQKEREKGISWQIAALYVHIWTCVGGICIMVLTRKRKGKNRDPQTRTSGFWTAFLIWLLAPRLRSVRFKSYVIRDKHAESGGTEASTRENKMTQTR
eukprot:976454-Pleurochrysis_carterae.AAC.1